MADLVPLESITFADEEKETTAAEPRFTELDDIEFAKVDEDDPTFFENVVTGADKLLDVGKGVVRGPWNLLTGIGETITGVVDYTLDTNITPSFSKAMNHMAEPYETKYTVGKVAEVGSEFGIEFIPFFKALGTVNRAARAKKAGVAMTPAASRIGRGLQKLGQSKYGQAMVDDALTVGGRLRSYAATGGLGAAYFGTTGALFAPDSRPTLLGDTFSEIPLPFTDAAIPLPFETERTPGLEGREYAGELLKRKLMRGLDTATLSVLGDAGMFGLGTAARSAPVAKTASGGARIIKDATNLASQKMAESALVKGMAKNPVIKRMGVAVEKPKRKLVEYFTPDGGADEFLSRSLRDTVDTGDALQRDALNALDDFHAATDDLLLQTKFWQQPKPGALALKNDLNSYMRGMIEREKFVDAWGEKAAKSVDRMNDHLFTFKDRQLAMLEKEIDSLAPGSQRRKKAEEALQIIVDADEAGEFYFRKLYEAHENPVRFLKNLDIKDPLYNKAIDEVATTLGFLPENRSLSEAQIRIMAKEQVNESIMLPALNRPNADFDTVVRDQIKALQEGNSKMSGLLSADAPKLSVKEDFLIKRKQALEKSPAFRALLGEINDPLEVYTRTVSDLVQSTTAKTYYDGLAINKRLAPTIDKAMDMLDNGGRPPIVMVPSALDFEVRNKLLRTAGKDTRTAASAANKEAPSEEAMLEIAERVGVNNTALEADELARMESILQSKGYVRLGGENAAEEAATAIYGGKYGKLNGMWVTPETRAMLNQPINLSPLAGLMSSLQAVRAFSQKMTIVPSPAGQARNIFGNMAMLAGNGNMHRGTNLLDTFFVFARSLDEIDDAGLRDIARRLNYSGLQDSSVIFKSLKEYQQMGRQLGAGEKVSNAFDKAEDIIPFMAQFQKLYQNSDAFFKSLALNGEYNKLAHALGRSGFTLDEPLLLSTLVDAGVAKSRSGRLEKMTFLEEIAANIVKDTMPMYNRIPQALRFVDRLPFFGNFTSFASENIRNGFNTIHLAAKELAFEISPQKRALIIEELGRRGIAPDVAEAQIKAFEGSIRANGSQRMFNTLAVANMVPASVRSLSQRLTNTSDAQMQAIEDSQEDFMAGDDFMVVTNDHKGNYTIINTSYHNPYGYIRSAANAALDAYAKSGRLNKNEFEQIMSGLGAFVSKMGDPFAAESMITERIADATIRGGKTKNGSTIYDQDQPKGDQIYNSILHIIEGLVPRYALEAYEADRGEVRPGKLNRALQGMPGKNGEELNLGQEFTRMAFGLTPIELKGGDQVEYAVYNYTQLRDPATSRAKAIVKDPDRTADEMYNAWVESVDSIARLQSQMYFDIERAKQLGVPEDEIKRRMRIANLGAAEIQSLIDGKLYLKTISDDLLKNVEERKQFEGFSQLEEPPVERILEYVRTMNERPVESRIYEEETGQAVAPSERYQVLDEINFADEPAPAPRFTPLDTIQFFDESALQPSLPASPAPAPQGQVDPTLLGGDPATQALAKSLGRSQ